MDVLIPASMFIADRNRQGTVADPGSPVDRTKNSWRFMKS